MFICWYLFMCVVWLSEKYDCDFGIISMIHVCVPATRNRYWNQCIFNTICKTCISILLIDKRTKYRCIGITIGLTLEWCNKLHLHIIQTVVKTSMANKSMYRKKTSTHTLSLLLFYLITLNMPIVIYDHTSFRVSHTMWFCDRPTFGR